MSPSKKPHTQNIFPPNGLDTVPINDRLARLVELLTPKPPRRVKCLRTTIYVYGPGLDGDRFEWRKDTTEIYDEGGRVRLVNVAAGKSFVIGPQLISTMEYFEGEG